MKNKLLKIGLLISIIFSLTACAYEYGDEINNAEKEEKQNSSTKYSEIDITEQLNYDYVDTEEYIKKYGIPTKEDARETINALDMLLARALDESKEYSVDISKLTARDRADMLYCFQYFSLDKRFTETAYGHFATKSDLKDFLNEHIGESTEDEISYLLSASAYQFGVDELSNGNIEMATTGDFGFAPDTMLSDINSDGCLSNGKYLYTGIIDRWNTKNNCYEAVGKYQIYFSPRINGRFNNWILDSVSISFDESTGRVEYPYDETSDPKLITKSSDTADMRKYELPISNAFASSELKPDGKNTYYVSNLFDKNISTAYVEGAKGQGIGERITIYFDKDFEYFNNGIYSIEINLGYQKSENIFWKNTRPARLKFIFYDPDTMEETVLYGSFDDVDMKKTVFNIEKTEGKPIVADKCVIYIEEVFPGSKYEDCCISELSFYTKAK